jgi:hypothetical protein
VLGCRALRERVATQHVDEHVAGQSLALEQPMHAVMQGRLDLDLVAEYLHSAVNNVNTVNY